MKKTLLIVLLLCSFATFATSTVQCLKAEIAAWDIPLVMNILNRNYANYKIYKNNDAYVVITKDMNLSSDPLSEKLNNLKNLSFFKDFNISFEETNFTECHNFGFIKDITKFIPEL